MRIISCLNYINLFPPSFGSFKNLTFYHIIWIPSFNLSLAVCCSPSSPDFIFVLYVLFTGAHFVAGFFFSYMVLYITVHMMSNIFLYLINFNVWNNNLSLCLSSHIGFSFSKIRILSNFLSMLSLSVRNTTQLFYFFF
jgi:hypothetical protein